MGPVEGDSHIRASISRSGQLCRWVGMFGALPSSWGPVLSSVRVGQFVES